jgi:hypothetical protein
MDASLPNFCNGKNIEARRRELRQAGITRAHICSWKLLAPSPLTPLQFRVSLCRHRTNILDLRQS